MITEQRFIELMKEDVHMDWDGDNAIQGLLIIAKYMDPAEHTLIGGAGHDIIWSVGIEDLIKAGITEHDIKSLRRLNWMLEDSSYLACYV